jgi:hypothetical protein|tara:strand:- start:224 stop:364 length:141 start_codon:yes stop_codon:yes gene_type:complete
MNFRNEKENKIFPDTLVVPDANDCKVFFWYSVLIMKTKEKKEREKK